MATYIKVVDGVPSIYNLRLQLAEDFPLMGKLPPPPKTSVNEYNRWLETLGIYPFGDEPRPVLTKTHRAERDDLPVRQSDGSWVRGWTVRQETSEELAERRASMKASRARFALATHVAGIVTATEAEDWAGGNALPQIVTDAFAANIADPTERLAARIEALTTANVHRTNPLIVMLQADLGLTDEQADELFD